MTIRIVAITVLCVAACVSETEPDDPSPVARAPCEDIVCGNAATLGKNPFWELDATGTQRSPTGGFRIRSFHGPLGAPLELRVNGFGLVGVSAAQQYVTGTALEHSTLEIDGADGVVYRLVLEKVGPVTYFECTGDCPPIPTYAWSYTYESSPGKRTPARWVCPRANLAPNTNTIYKNAILFTGDRYDRATGTVQTIGDTSPWFNFACNDDVLWKMAVFRYAQPASYGAYVTSIADRDAAIRSIRADYCGDDHAWTETGTSVDWANRGGWLTHAEDGMTVEAIWNANGAVCLTKPRLYQKSEISCGAKRVPPDCTPDQIAHWAADGHQFITYVP